MSAQRKKSAVTSTQAIHLNEDRGDQSLGQAGKVKSYAWLQYGEIVINDRVFKHGDPVLLDESDPAVHYLTCLDFDLKSPDAD